MRWRHFLNEPPYDAKKDEEAGFETDRISAWFIYRYLHRPWLAPDWCCLSHKACEFFDGVFTEYKSHMKTSPYPEDKIEILAWCPAEEVREWLKPTFKGWCTNNSGDGPCKGCDCGS